MTGRPKAREGAQRLPKAAAALRFTRLSLRNWRNFESVDIALTDRAFFVGSNASGKSNLLDVFRFLGEISVLGNGGLQAAIERRSGFAALRNLNARAQSDVRIEVEVGDGGNSSEWSYTLRLNRRRAEKIATVLEETVRQGTTVVLERVRAPDDQEFLFAQTAVEQSESSKGFRALCDFFSSCQYLHVVPQIVREPERGKKVGDDPFGGDLLRRINAMPTKMRDPRLRRISGALKIAVPQFESLELELDNGVPHLAARYKHWRPNGSKQREEQFSDGTLRLIGLLWAISERGGPLLLEEPELSLNDGVIAQIPRMILRMQSLSKRQVLMTTHSMALLRDDVGLLEVHRIHAGAKGSVVSTIAHEPAIVGEVDGGMTIADAVAPLLAPDNVERLSTIDIAA